MVAPVAELRALGVYSWTLDADRFETDAKLEAIRQVRGYSYQVCGASISSSPQDSDCTLQPDTLRATWIGANC